MTTAPLSPAPSTMSEQQFMDAFGTLYEHSPWVAKETWRNGLTHEQDNLVGLAAALQKTVDSASRDRQLELINAHPDLAGRAAIAGQLSEQSQSEQAAAGIDQCSAAEYARFTDLNKCYREKFGFPFIMAVKGSNRHEILQAFERRIKHDYETEFRHALTEIHCIVKFRLEAMVGDV